MVKRFIAAVAAAATVMAVAVAGAGAAPQPQSFTCQGALGTIQILVGPANGTQNNKNDITSWGAARVVGGGILIPTSFSFTIYDNTISQVLFSSTTAKGNGNANPNQTTTTCSQSQTTTLGAVFPPGTPLPTGASLSDTVTLTFSATVIVKP